MKGDNMPGYILHLLHGILFLEQFGSNYSEIQKKQFTMGLLMPDSNKAVKKKKTALISML